MFSFILECIVQVVFGWKLDDEAEKISIGDRVQGLEVLISFRYFTSAFRQ